MDSSFDSAPWNDAAWNDALYLEALRNGFVMDEDPLGVSPFHEAPLALSDLAFFNEAISGPNPVDKVPTGLVPFDDASPTLIPSNSASSSLNQSVSSDVPTSPAPSSQDSELPSPLSLEYAAAPAKNLPAPTVVYLMYDESYYKNFGEKKSTQGGTLEDAFESLDDANYACWYKFHDWDKSEMRLYKQEFDEEGKLEIDVLYPCGLGCRTYIVSLEITPSIKKYGYPF